MNALFACFKYTKKERRKYFVSYFKFETKFLRTKSIVIIYHNVTIFEY